MIKYCIFDTIIMVNGMNNIQTFFNSNIFYNLLRDINVKKTDNWGNEFEENYYISKVEEATQYIVEQSLRFYLVFKDDPNVFSLLTNYIRRIIPVINNLNQLDIYEKCDSLILEYLYKKEQENYSTEMSEETKKKLFDKLYQNIISKNYAFHAFNSTALESIKEHGINPNFYLTKQQDIDEISNIFKKYNLNNPFFMQSKNCIGKVSYSSGPNVSYGYGIDSPEWFVNFCNKNYHNLGYNPYTRREYDVALDSIKKTITDFDENDKKTVINFFNKNWNIYGTKENIPVLAICPLENDEDYNYEYNNFKKNPEFYFQWLCLDRHRCDTHIEKIDTKDALFIELPSYNKIIDFAKKKYKGEILETPNDSLKELSDYFNSEQFYDLINSYNSKKTSLKSKIGDLINYIIKYSLIIGVEDINEFTKNFINLCNSNNEPSKAFVEIIKIKVSKNLKESNEIVNEENIRHYISSRIGNTKYIFHAFNSSKFESIKKYGITTNISSVYEEKQDIEKIKNIANKYFDVESLSLFGCYREKSKDKVYYSESPENSYDYSNRSPEWFAYFVGESSLYPASKRNTLLEKNYEQAKENIIDLVNRFNFNEEDKKEVFDFFEKYWKLYGNTKPMLAIIGIENDYSWLDGLPLDTYIKQIISGDINASTYEKISTENAKFIYLTDYAKIKNYINNNNNNNNFINYLESYIELKNTVKKITTKIKYSSTKIDDYHQSNNPLMVKFIEAHKKVLFESADELRKHKKTLYDLKNGLDMFVQMEENNILILLNYLSNKIGELKNSNTSEELINLYKEVYDEFRLAKVYEENNNTKSR